MKTIIIGSICIIIYIIFLFYFIHILNTEKFTDVNYYLKSLNNRKSINLDLLETNTYLGKTYKINNNREDTYNYKGPIWKNEFEYDNLEVLKNEDKLNNIIINKKVNNSTYCGGINNKCNTTFDCCNNLHCFSGICVF